MPAGLSMEEGMGMLRHGNATSEKNGPSVGRGMGVGSTHEQAMGNGPLSADQARQSMPGMQHEGMETAAPEVSKDANSVPGFPQDAFMEGPAMAMDKMVEKPETYGLRPAWSGFMQGMMTFLRVLPPEMFDRVMALRERQKAKPEPRPEIEHQHQG